MRRRLIYLIPLLLLFAFFLGQKVATKVSQTPQSEILAAGSIEKFNFLSKSGNSSCSATFRDSILGMSDDARLQGSCCSPMSVHRYSEQVEGLKKYANIAEIPPDPYDVEAGLAKRLLAYYEAELSSDEQAAYDYAMENSDEKGPCCCRCWRWNVYGGLGKYLIKNYGFTGEQVTEVWNLSDGCGGDNEHRGHT